MINVQRYKSFLKHHWKKAIGWQKLGSDMSSEMHKWKRTLPRTLQHFLYETLTMWQWTWFGGNGRTCWHSAFSLSGRGTPSNHPIHSHWQVPFKLLFFSCLRQTNSSLLSVNKHLFSSAYCTNERREEGPGEREGELHLPDSATL